MILLLDPVTSLTQKLSLPSVSKLMSVLGDAVTRPNDVTYSQIQMNNLKSHSEAEPSDVTYAEINQKDKKPKKAPVKERPERPKPTVDVHPADHVFTGETVTLTCGIESGDGWQYQWNKNDAPLSDASGKEYTISDVSKEDGGAYTCTETQSAEPLHLQTSDPVTLTVSDKPKPTVNVAPQSSVYTGDTVTLTCEVGQSTGWSFVWYTDPQSLQSQYTADKDTNTISVTESDVETVGFVCAAHRGTYSTQRSDPVRITVTARPKPTVRVQPADHVFIGETVTLTCDIESGAGWQYQWSKGNKALSEAQWKKIYNTFTADQSYKGDYTCRGTQSTERCCYSQTSEAVTLTVSEKPKPTVRVTSRSSVYTGDTVTLTCKVGQSAGWSFVWYTDPQSLQSQYPADKNPNTISVTVSDAGPAEFTCAAHRGTYSTQRSDPVRITVTARPKPTVRVQPAVHVFIGETVTLTCDIEGGAGWQYQWSKDNKALSKAQWKKIYNTFTADQSYKGDYTCRGTQSTERCCYSQTSEAVRLTVSEKPKPTVAAMSQRSVYSGDTVTLTCEVGQSTGWSFVWYKGSQSLQSQYPADKNPNTISVTVSGTAGFTCAAYRGEYYTQRSAPVRITVTARPKATVSVQPAGHVLTGEGVTLTCGIESGRDWQYQWYKDNIALSSAQWWNTYTISSVGQYHNGVYTCRGTRSTETCCYSQTSEAVTLTVSDTPKLTVRVTSQSSVYTGDTVTLTCEVEQSAGWRFLWYKDSQQLQSQYPADKNPNTISVTVSDAGTPGFTCAAYRQEYFTYHRYRSSYLPSYYYYTEYSGPAVITVKALPTATLTAHPESRVFTGESVTLKCVINTHDGWTYQWSKLYYRNRWAAVSQSEYHTVNRDTLTIRGDAVFNRDQYRCRGERTGRPTSSQNSSPVTLTVEGKTTSFKTFISSYSPVSFLTVLEPRWSPLFTGESVTLKCEIQSYSNWRYQWYKGSSRTAASQSQTHTFTIRSAADQDQYWCRGERDNRPTSSQYSRTVTLTVEGLYKSEATSDSVDMNTFIASVELPSLSGTQANLLDSLITLDKLRAATVSLRKRKSCGLDSIPPELLLEIWDLVGPLLLNSIWYSLKIGHYHRDQRAALISLLLKRQDRGLDKQRQDRGLDKRRLDRGPDKRRLDRGPDKRRLDRGLDRDKDYSGDRNRDSNRNRDGQHCRHWNINIDSDRNRDIHSDRDEHKTRNRRRTVHRRKQRTIIRKTGRELRSGLGRELWSGRAGNSEAGRAENCGAGRAGVSGFIDKAAVSDVQHPRVQAGQVRRPRAQAGLLRRARKQEGLPHLSLSLMVSPSRTQHFTNDSLSLSCEGQSNSTGGRVRRYTLNKNESDCSSGWGSASGSTCNISSLSTSHTGVYWCESEFGGSSDPVNITVHNGSVILESPVHPVPEGDPLTLHCLYHHTNSSNLTAEFYKDGSLLQTRTPGEMTIRTVSKSDEGLYHCKHPERGESPQSWISVRGERFLII
ncbi:hypothetical protein NFI96_029375, partial [Prochilodus magdalenae]